jgi:beta-glucosidase
MCEYFKINEKKTMRRLVILFILLGFAGMSCTSNSGNDGNTNGIEFKVDSLLEMMTLQEKIGQLNQYSVGAELTGPGAKSDHDQTRIDLLTSGQVGSVLNLLGAEQTRKLQKQVVENSRLGIPLLFSYDVIHGYKTMFPIPLGESASWDLEAIEQSAAIAAMEAAAAGLHWTFAPMVDVGRDARWGRVMEGAGEDTYLGAQIAKARVNGFQGEDLSLNSTIAACAKHFAGYGFVESGKEYNNVYMGKSMLLNTIIPPFQAANEVGVATFMNAFNDIDGVPSTANDYLLKDLLKESWGFDGLVVSDWNSIGELVYHGTAANDEEAAIYAINAGTDMDMEGDVFIENLFTAVEAGHVKEETLNDAVRRVLRIKFRLGLFEDPYRYSNQQRELKTLLHKDHLAASRDVARKSIVLLKNEAELLPLQNPTNIAVIGPLAKDKDSPLGNWRAAGEGNSAVSFYEGITAALENTHIGYAAGCKLSIGANNFFNETVVEQSDRSGFAEAIQVAKNAEVVFMVLGETAFMSGEARSRVDIGLPGLQLELLQEVYKVNQNIVLVLMNGRPLTIPWAADNIPTILETWHLGSEAGHAIADVITGKYNPSGKLTMSFPRDVGQLPIYYNHKNTGRASTEPGIVFYSHFGDVDNTPLYPFGYGIGYSSFEYTGLHLKKSKMTNEDSLQVKLTVINNGKMDGEEVVQLYIQDLVGSITRPVKELKDFKKVFIRSGEHKEISFVITADDLSFYRKDFSYGTEPGAFKVYVGGNSRDVMTAKFELVE